ncbi:thiamine-phosphate pyrophosphorylase [Microbacterium endophyticum]|uniref:Thiamine-phosphate synthase n=1 Tax=Microbacterium endophyticum TaxID=1526412 RepID=A0A7W4YM65_9MICO|nr:thiamine phosphate synthase [Microbacterium endophyticum]MBB2976150.1 thiamine-phosphate pyrophosphorylase [Microbacterium endophyticum]NIK36447.1 thiamine-phosphate pyrophosphorylase [Microbacterium endophyticum]
MNIDLSLYLVTDAKIATDAGHDLIELMHTAARHGVTTVQVREKDASPRRFLETVLRISETLPPHVSLLVNDRIDVYLAARAAGARVAGVHVGQSDLPVAAVREMIGPDAVLGLSASTEEQLRAAASGAGNVNYVGIGALHATATKKDAPPSLGIVRFAQLVAASALPAVAIGGVTRHDLAGLRRAGAAGAAVVSAVCAAPDPGVAALELRQAWESAA